MRFQPKISIVIPVYNGVNFMRKAIDSALTQTYTNFEVIVVNDGSVDNTEEIALSYGDKIRYYKKENGGQSTALNYGIEKMTGDYFSWLSHDDVYLPTKLEKQINFLARLKNKNTILYSDYDTIDHESNIISTKRLNHIPSEDFLLSLITDSPISGCSTLISKKCFEEKGCFKNDIPYTSDYEMWFRLGLYYPFENVPEVLIQSRVHDEQVSVRKRKEHLKESNALLAEFIKKIEKENLQICDLQRSRTDIYATLAKNLSSRGYMVFRQLIKYSVERSEKISKIAVFVTLTLQCNYLFFKKSLRLKIKFLLKRLGLYKKVALN